MKLFKLCTFVLMLLTLTTCDLFKMKVKPPDGCNLESLRDLKISNLSGRVLATPPSNKVSVSFQVRENNASGKPVPNLQETDFSIWEKGEGETCFNEKTSNAETNKKIVLNPQRFKFSTMLVLDLSKSITSVYLEDLKNAAKSFVEKVMPETGSASFTMGIWWFDGSAQIKQLVNFSSNRTELTSAIDRITAQISTDGSTNLHGAVIQSATIANLRVAEFTKQEIIAGAAVVYFTDGRDEASRNSKPDALNAINSAQNVSQDRIRFLSLGIGNETNLQDLKDFGPDGFLPASDKSQLETKFLEIGKLVSDEAYSYYILEYCSGKRNGKVEVSLVANYNTGGKKSKTLRGTLSGLTYSAIGFQDLCK